MDGILLNTALVAAVVSALVTALGWFVSHWSERKLENARRQEKVVDVQTALLAEIVSNLRRFSEIDLEAHGALMNRNILASKGAARFTPFVPRFPSEIVFEAILGEIHILPTAAIGDVIAYYKQEYKLRELVEDLRSERYERLTQDRKAAVYADYIWQIESALAAGNAAQDALVRSLRLPGPPSILNNLAAGQSRASGNRKDEVLTAP